MFDVRRIMEVGVVTYFKILDTGKDEGNKEMCRDSRRLTDVRIVIQ
jgi:hypothetical protein